LNAVVTAGAGDIYLLGEHTDGFSPRLEHQDENYDSAEIRINLSAKVGLGDVKISRQKNQG
jgi:predicted membrane protein